MLLPHPKQSEIIHFLKALREKIILNFENLENGSSFERTPWKYDSEGGGEIALLRGKVFEKAAVNWSKVGGPSYPLANEKGAFFAMGISVITHMTNPHAPTAHFNIRFIETVNQFWFGGGYDLTPMGFPYEEDTQHFHRTAKEAIEPFGADLYDLFSKNAKEYFFIPHRNKERGIGGIFFDHYNTGNFERDKQLLEAIGESFLAAIIPIYHKRIAQPYQSYEREQQLAHRAHYVEFNLLYDRGTRFGFQSKGNPDAILCSMPPLVKW